MLKGDFTRPVVDRRYLMGTVIGISPEAPVPVLQLREEQYSLGGAANVAKCLMALGARCQGFAAQRNLALEGMPWPQSQQ